MLIRPAKPHGPQFFHHHPLEVKDLTDDEESDSADFVPTLDARNFTSQKYESRFKWLYFSSITKGYMCTP